MRLADGELVRLSQMSGLRQISLSQPRHHLGLRNLRNPTPKVLPARGLTSQTFQGGSGVYLPPSLFHTSEKLFKEKESNNNPCILSLKLEAGAGVLLAQIRN